MPMEADIEKLIMAIADVAVILAAIIAKHVSRKEKQHHNHKEDNHHGT